MEFYSYPPELPSSSSESSSISESVNISNVGISVRPSFVKCSTLLNSSLYILSFLINYGNSSSKLLLKSGSK